MSNDDSKIITINGWKFEDVTDKTVSDNAYDYEKH